MILNVVNVIPPYYTGHSKSKILHLQPSKIVDYHKKCLDQGYDAIRTEFVSRPDINENVEDDIKQSCKLALKALECKDAVLFGTVPQCATETGVFELIHFYRKVINLYVENGVRQLWFDGFDNILHLKVIAFIIKHRMDLLAVVTFNPNVTKEFLLSALTVCCVRDILGVGFSYKVRKELSDILCDYSVQPLVGCSYENSRPLTNYSYLISSPEFNSVKQKPVVRDSSVRADVISNLLSYDHEKLTLSVDSKSFIQVDFESHPEFSVSELRETLKKCNCTDSILLLSSKLWLSKTDILLPNVCYFEVSLDNFDYNSLFEQSGGYVVDIRSNDQFMKLITAHGIGVLEKLILRLDNCPDSSVEESLTIYGCSYFARYILGGKLYTVNRVDMALNTH